MWNPPTYEELQKLHPIGHYSETPLPDIQINQHYFIGGADWWVAECNPIEKLLYGYVNLGDKQNAEWGYTSLDELMNLSITPEGSPFPFEIDRDLHWKPRPVSAIKGITDCYKAQGLGKLLYGK